jgi:hypothetical protein
MHALSNSADNNVTIQCPVEKGDHIITHTVTLPKEIPKGAHFTTVLTG